MATLTRKDLQISLYSEITATMLFRIDWIIDQRPSMTPNDRTVYFSFAATYVMHVSMRDTFSL